MTFEPKHDSEWENFVVKLPVEKKLTGLRIEPSTAAGEMRFEILQIKDKDGKVLKSLLPASPMKK